MLAVGVQLQTEEEGGNTETVAPCAVGRFHVGLRICFGLHISTDSLVW